MAQAKQVTFESVKIGQLFIWGDTVFVKDFKTTGYNMHTGRSQKFKLNNVVETV
jgi:hypothetical protein